MEIFYYIIIFIFGAIIGSFLNVVINRYNTGLSLNGRSICFSCGKKLPWYELIPIISFLAQFGRCRGCESKISWQYISVELSTGVVFVLSLFYVYTNQESGIMNYGIQNNLYLIYLWIISSILIVIAVYDIKHKIIPNGFVYAFILLSFLGLFITFSPSDIYLVVRPPSGWDLLAGPILAAPFAFLWFVSRGTWMGFGDAKLSLGIGWILGLYYGISAITLAFWVGAIFGVILLIANKMGLFLGGKKLTIKSEIPFGPFLILGFFLVLFFGIDAFNLISFTSF